jgi:transposase-like protein
MKTTVMTLAKQIKTEADAYSYMESLRWPDGPICPHCGSVEKHYFLKPREGNARKTRTGSLTERRVWKCKTCRKQFSVTTGTVFHGSKVPLHTWLMVVFEMCANKNGIAAREIARKYGVAPKTAWFMTHRLREAMKSKAPQALLSGTIISDETWVGGDPENRHGHRANKGVQGKTEKTPVVTLIDTSTREARSRAIPTVTGRTLRDLIAESVDMPHTILHTDASNRYNIVARELAGRLIVNHRQGEYVSAEGVSTNIAETYFSQLKRSLDGTHHHVSRAHLQRYVTEFDFRFSTCHLDDTERMEKLMRQVGGRRLAYQ